jgi:sec-independent protein translocase protein TatA
VITALLTPTHVALLLVIVLIVLGPKRLPEAGRALGRALHEFKQGVSGRDLPPVTESGSRVEPNPEEIRMPISRCGS